MQNLCVPKSGRQYSFRSSLFPGFCFLLKLLNYFSFFYLFIFNANAFVWKLFTASLTTCKDGSLKHHLLTPEIAIT